MKKHLTFDHDIDFSILGISCHIKDYRLTWEINQTLSLDLEKADDVYSQYLKSDFGFSTSAYYNEDEMLSYMLISNKNEGGVFIPEYPQLDFLFRLEGPQHELEIGICKDRLQTINAVLAAIEIDPNSLKSKMNFVF